MRKNIATIVKRTKPCVRYDPEALLPLNQAQAAEETVNEEISKAINSDKDNLIIIMYRSIYGTVTHFMDLQGDDSYG